MKLGIFDSGLGGLLITRAVRERIPDIDMIYLGDTLHVPYGNRSEEAIYAYTERCVDFLFREGCNLIIVACNTASASALRRIQQGYLPANYPDRRVLGVVVPTIEAALDRGCVDLGLIGTNYTVGSNVYGYELSKINPEISLKQVSTPLLVPMIEYDGWEWIGPVLERYLRPLQRAGVKTLLLSCTHYVCLKERVRSEFGMEVLSQDEIIPEKLVDYLSRHPEIDGPIGRTGLTRFCVTDCTDNYRKAARELYGDDVILETVKVYDGY